MTALPEVRCRFIAVPRHCGQQLKEPAQLDALARPVRSGERRARAVLLQ